jgi:hypothetical protein
MSATPAKSVPPHPHSSLANMSPANSGRIQPNADRSWYQQSTPRSYREAHSGSAGNGSGGVGEERIDEERLDAVEREHEAKGCEVHADLGSDPVGVGLSRPALLSLYTPAASGKTHKDEQAYGEDDHADLGEDELGVSIVDGLAESPESDSIRSQDSLGTRVALHRRSSSTSACISDLGRLQLWWQRSEIQALWVSTHHHMGRSRPRSDAPRPMYDRDKVAGPH